MQELDLHILNFVDYKPADYSAETSADGLYRPYLDQEAVDAFQWIARREGILTALETSHAVAHLKHMKEDLILLNLSGRGDKDLDHVMTWLKDRT